MSQDDLSLPVDEAHLTALHLSSHILEYANAYRLLSAQEEYIGRARMRYALLLIMFEEMAKLMELMKDCERAVTEKDPIVTIPDFHARKEHSDQALSNILKELGKSETLIALFKRVIGRAPTQVDFDLLRQQFSQGPASLDAKVRSLLHYDLRKDTDHADIIPEQDMLDMYFEAVVLNAEAAREFIHEWARAKELDLETRLKARRVEAGKKTIKLWYSEEMPQGQRNFQG